MTTHPTEISTELPCHRCGYDLRAHPPDGKCPECGESVAAFTPQFAEISGVTAIRAEPYTATIRKALRLLVECWSTDVASAIEL
jgi:threonine synthase